MYKLVNHYVCYSNVLADSSLAKKRYSRSPLSSRLLTQNALQKKKCDEKRPQCDRCIERDILCEYEEIRPRKRLRTSFAESALSHNVISPDFCPEGWSEESEAFSPIISDDKLLGGKEASNFQYAGSETSTWESIGKGDDVNDVPHSEIRHVFLPKLSTTVARRSHCPDLAMIAPSSTTSPLFEFRSPVFQEFTELHNRRGLIDHFCNVLSHLIVFKEDTGNPFRQLILPLSYSSPPIMNAIFALSSAHLEHKGIEHQEKSLDFHNRALQGLAMMIEQSNDSNREEILGAIMLLVYYEVLVQRGKENIVNGHLKGALTVMRASSITETPATRFLKRAFRFYDTITALSLGTPPISTELPSSETASVMPNADLTFPMSPLGSVDTLLGFSTDLWPIIHRLSHLLSIKNDIEEAVASDQLSKARVLQTELESTAQAIELALSNWKPTITSSTTSNDSDSSASALTEDYRIRSILNNAEAYRNSAFVYLHRTIYSQAQKYPSVQKHAHASLVACSNVVRLSEKCSDGPMSALLWPLFVAACEAVEDIDRGLAEEAFQGIEKRQGMNNISRAWEVLKEVWRRGDAGEEDIDWREVCSERDWNIVLG